MAFIRLNWVKNAVICYFWLNSMGKISIDKIVIVSKFDDICFAQRYQNFICRSVVCLFYLQFNTHNSNTSSEQIVFILIWTCVMCVALNFNCIYINLCRTLWNVNKTGNKEKINLSKSRQLIFFTVLQLLYRTIVAECYLHSNYTQYYVECQWHNLGKVFVQYNWEFENGKFKSIFAYR